MVKEASHNLRSFTDIDCIRIQLQLLAESRGSLHQRIMILAGATQGQHGPCRSRSETANRVHARSLFAAMEVGEGKTA